jgi:hypothetical protein
VKRSIDIADQILRAARKLATREVATLRAVAGQGLRYVVSRRKRKQQFRLCLVTSGGKGLRSELQDASWDHIRALSYEIDDE